MKGGSFDRGMSAGNEIVAGLVVVVAAAVGPGRCFYFSSFRAVSTSETTLISPGERGQSVEDEIAVYLLLFVSQRIRDRYRIKMKLICRYI